MADTSDFSIPITADASDAVAAFDQLASSAEAAGAAVAESFGRAEPVIRDFATEMQSASVSAEEFAAGIAAWTAAQDLAGASMASTAEELAAMRAELDGTAEAARA